MSNNDHLKKEKTMAKVTVIACVSGLGQMRRGYKKFVTFCVPIRILDNEISVNINT